MLPRVYYKQKNLDKEPKKDQAGNYPPLEQAEDVPEEEANLVSSKLQYIGSNLHAPALDVDFPVECYESSTPGHYHVYIDVPMPWWKYRIMLWWMTKCGIIERGYYKASVKRKATYLRKKGVYKPGAQQNNQNQQVHHQPWANWH